MGEIAGIQDSPVQPNTLFPILKGYDTCLLFFLQEFENILAQDSVNFVIILSEPIDTV